MATLTDFPCRNCVAPKRHPGCHSTCEEYITAKAENERLNDIRRRHQQEKAAQYESALKLKKYCERERRKRR